MSNLHKLNLCSIAILSFAVEGVFGGTREIQAAYQQKTYQKERLSSYSLTNSPDITYYGILPRELTMSRPLELFNPFASKKYGYGRDLVSWNSREGKPKGFIVAGIRFW